MSDFTVHQEKRKWQTEIENKKRQLEDDRRALQHLKVTDTERCRYRQVWSVILTLCCSVEGSKRALAAGWTGTG